MIVAGVDEAGRGSILGPLIIAGIRIDKSKMKHLRSLDVKDSKKLRPQARQKLYKKILKVIDKYYLCRLQPEQIDRFVSKRRLNSLEANAMAIVINRLKPQIAYVDSCDVKPERFRKAVMSTLKCKARVTSSHHADTNNLAVSAASIIAKVNRDKEIAEIRKKIGDVGSGYPSDKKTMRFIKRWVRMHKKGPKCARSSWKPLRELLNGCA
ncbi:MAG: ribonuclease HII [Nitrososphaerales archaeon]